ncbi:MAG: hypothetical protein IJX74_05220 [Clostridia bacterium]|nr:hypothetical protein [Clostridia bacterium]
MKIKASKLLAVLCVVATIISTLVPTAIFTAAAAEETVTYTFSNYTAGTQYAENETHVMDDSLTIVTYDCHFTTQLRIYSSSTNNGYAILQCTDSTKTISGLSMNAGNKKDTVNIYGSDDGSTWTSSPIATVATTTTSYADYTASFNGAAYKWLKLDVAGSNQVRVASITVTYTVSESDTTSTPAETETTPAETETTPAATYTATFSVPEGCTTPEAQADVTAATMPEAVEFSDAKYTFVGWASSEITESFDAPTFYNAGETVELTADTTFYAVYSYVSANGSTETAYAKTNIDAIEATDVVVITMTTSNGNGTVYALTSGNGTSDAPAATVITVADDKISSDVTDAIKWNISNNSGTLTIYPNGTTETWLYCTSSNNGVRVGTNTANTFSIDNASGYLKHTGTSRYLGVYTTTPDWRCYTNTTGNTANQTLAFYVEKTITNNTAYTTAPVASTCDHANTTTTTIDATCTEDGSITVKCDSCEGILSTEVIPATGHQNTTETTVDASCTTDGSITVTCDDCGATISTTVIPAGHNYVDNVCTGCGEKLPDYSGRYYIATIRSSGNYFYMTNDLGTASTKRYQAVDSSLTELPATITTPEDSYVFVLVNNGDGTYCIYAEGVDGDNYLGWTSGNSGILVAEENALKVTVDINDDGTYNIHFTGDAERYLALNGTTGSNYFAWYKNGQKQNLSLIPVVEEAPVAEITNAAVNLGADLSMLYKVTLATGENIADYRMVFEFNGETVEATSEDGVFALNGIAPQQMGYTINATLYKGDVVIDTLDYSIKAYAEEILAGEYSDEAKALVQAMINYGDAAENYVNQTEPTTNVDVTGTTKPETVLTTEQNATKVDGLSFSSVGVRFDYVNKIYVTLTNTIDADVTVTINGEAATIVDGVIYTDAISATKFADSYTIVLNYNGEAYQTVTYSVNSYASAKWDSETAYTSELVRAMYLYGVAAEAYNNAQ